MEDRITPKLFLALFDLNVVLRQLKLSFTSTSTRDRRLLIPSTREWSRV